MRTKLVSLHHVFGCLALCLGQVPLASSADEQRYTLKYRFEAGQSVQYNVDNKTQVHMQKGQASQHIEHGSLTDKQYIVRTVDADGNAELELQIDRVRMSAGVDGADSVEYDSDSGEVPPDSLQGIADTVGKPHVRVTVSPAGHLLGIDWLVGADNTQKPTIKDEASLDIMVVLPPEPMTIGQTWKQPFEVTVTAGPKLNKSVKLQREYTLNSVQADQATITLKTTVITSLHDPAQECQLIGKLLSGTIVFDMSRGVVVSRTLNVDRMVVGFEGADSKIHNISQRTEKLTEPKIAVDESSEAVRK